MEIYYSKAKGRDAQTEDFKSNREEKRIMKECPPGTKGRLRNKKEEGR